MITHESLELAALTRAVQELRSLVESVREARKPVFKEYQISSSNPYIVDYQERKHIFLWLPSTSLTLSFEDYGQGTVQAQVWTNIGMPVGTRVLAVGQVANTPIFVCCTDEVIP
jgi:hypothetical protein